MEYQHIDADAIIAEMEQHHLNNTWPEPEKELLEAMETAFTDVSDSCSAFEKEITRSAEIIGMGRQFEKDEYARSLQQRDTAISWASNVMVRLRSENKYERSEVTSELVDPYETLLRYQDIIHTLFDLLVAQEMARRASPLYRVRAFLKRLTARN